MKKLVIVIITLFYSFIGTNMLFAIDTWTEKAAFVGGAGRFAAVGFSIGTKGYIGTGFTDTSVTNDFWEYDTVNDTWTQMANFSGGARYRAVGFSIGTKGYVGMGYADDSGAYKRDLWEYSPPPTNAWIEKARLDNGRWYSAGFSIDNKGYVGLGVAGGETNDFWEYDPAIGADGTWTRKAAFPGQGRLSAVGFSIGSKGYVGTGTVAGVKVKDFWEYTPGSGFLGGSWAQKTDFAGGDRDGAVGFSIGTKGYVGTGNKNGSPTQVKDFWEYDSLADTWAPKTDFEGTARDSAVALSIGSKRYIGTGRDIDGYRVNELWEYEPIATTFSWNNGSGFWSESANWSPVKVPDSGDDVFIINSGAGIITVSTTVAAKTLTVGGEKKITLSTGKLTIGTGD